MQIAVGIDSTVVNVVAYLATTNNIELDSTEAGWSGALGGNDQRTAPGAPELNQRPTPLAT